MKQSLTALIVGLIIGAFIAIKYFPTTIEKPIEIVKTETKTKTITKEVVRPNGQIEREIVAITDSKTESQSKLPPNWHIAINRLVTNRQNDVYGLTINRRIAGQFFINAGINTEKQVSVGLGIEF